MEAQALCHGRRALAAAAVPALCRKRLDGACPGHEVSHMHKTPALPVAASLAALLALGACNNKPTTVIAKEDDPQAEQLKNAKPVAPPPMIQASRTYRCKDNSLLYADFYTNNTVSVRTRKEGGTPTVLTAADGKPPYTAPGYSVSANSESISFTAPGKGAQPCDTK
ncbi:MAG: hypothetical protein QOK17_140 [Sphingomonadales bacterium]|jgi:hypothetical protein|nr:hypothetical protein [Sphingomonadales bacterium]